MLSTWAMVMRSRPGCLARSAILGELIVKPGFRRRHLAVGQGDAIEHADQALGHRAQIVQHRRAELDLAERRAPVFGLAFAVILEQQAAAARHQQRVAGRTRGRRAAFRPGARRSRHRRRRPALLKTS